MQYIENHSQCLLKIYLCYADNCPEIYYSVSSVESNQRPNTGNKTNTARAWSLAPAPCQAPLVSVVGAGASQVVCHLPLNPS